MDLSVLLDPLDLLDLLEAQELPAEMEHLEDPVLLVHQERTD